MGDLRVFIGRSAQAELCAAFDSARRTIDADFYSLSDERVIDSLKRAAARPGVSVRVHIEGNPKRYDNRDVSAEASIGRVYDRLHERLGDEVRLVVDADGELLHAKAAVVDGKRALINTANMTRSGFLSRGEAMVEDSDPADVLALEEFMHGHTAWSQRVVAGSRSDLRVRLDLLLDAPRNLSVAVEDLSDPHIIAKLIERREQGKTDRVIVDHDFAPRRYGAKAIEWLRANGVDVRALAHHAYMHEKYIDGGDAIYVGSANCTRNGLDEAQEAGVVAPSADFEDGGRKLRKYFNLLWREAKPV